MQIVHRQIDRQTDRQNIHIHKIRCKIMKKKRVGGVLGVVAHFFFFFLYQQWLTDICESGAKQST
jgi:hypothetical protein